MDQPQSNDPNAPFDVEGFYEAHVYGDVVRSDVRALTPMRFDDDGFIVVDLKRPQRFFSAVKVTLGPQSFTVPFEIKADSLRQALTESVAQGRAAAEKFAADLDEQRTRTRLLHANGMPGTPGVTPPGRLN